MYVCMYVYILVLGGIENFYYDYYLEFNTIITVLYKHFIVNIYPLKMIFDDQDCHIIGLLK